MKKRVFALVLALALACTLLPTAALAAGNSVSDATPISFGETVEGSLSRANLTDSYQITLPASGRLDAHITSTVYWLDYKVYNKSGTRIFDDTISVSSKTVSVDLVAGDYYIIMTPWSNSYSGNYTLSLELTSANESFHEDQDTVNNTFETALDITTGKDYIGQIAYNESGDYYKFTLPSSGLLNFDMTASMSMINYALYDSAGSKLYSPGAYLSASSSTKRIHENRSWDLVAGTYYIAIIRHKTATGNYSLRLDFTSANESLAESQDKGNNSMSAAFDISLDETYQGQIAYNDSADWYKFTLPFSGVLTFDMTAGISMLDYYLYNSAGDKVYAPNSYLSASSSTKRIRETRSWTLDQGTYYIDIARHNYAFGDGGATGNYSFSLSLKESEPENVTVTLNANNNTTNQTVTVVKGETMTTPTDPTRSGYTFGGWYTDSACTKAWNFDTAVTADMTLYAKWTAVETKTEAETKTETETQTGTGTGTDTTTGTETVTVSFGICTNDFANTVYFPTPIAKTVTKGEPMAAPQLSTSTTGYTLEGWYTDKEGTKAWNFANPVTGDMTLYAKWVASESQAEPEDKIETVTVTLKLNNGESDKTMTVTKGKTLSTPIKPSRSGYLFDGWYADSGLTTAWNFASAVNADMTLYAKWTEVTSEPETVTVTLKYNNGDSDKTVTVTKGDTMGVPANPSREGYTFGGWYTDEACATAWNFNSAVTKNMTLYAKWTEVSSKATQTGKSNQTITVDNKEVTLDAYTLKADNGGDVTYVKLRDVAAVLNGTQAQFDVQWLTGAIYVIPNTPYVSQNGAELQPIQTRDNSFRWNDNPILFGGVTKPLEGIILIDVNEGGHTFFKLRDLGAAIGFHVDWSAERGIYIETK